MPVITVETPIAAPPDRCFDLARDATVHAQSLAHTGERVVSRTGSGLLALGDTVTWEAKHFGVRQRLTARITRFEPPQRFTDEMVRGAFKGFTHTHEFVPMADGTLMIDTFDYAAPLGILGRLAERLFLTRYMRRLLAERGQHLKRLAEAEG